MGLNTLSVGSNFEASNRATKMLLPSTAGRNCGLGTGGRTGLGTTDGDSKRDFESRRRVASAWNTCMYQMLRANDESCLQVQRRNMPAFRHLPSSAGLVWTRVPPSGSWLSSEDVSATYSQTEAIGCRKQPSIFTGLQQPHVGAYHLNSHPGSQRIEH